MVEFGQAWPRRDSREGVRLHLGDERVDALGHLHGEMSLLASIVSDVHVVLVGGFSKAYSSLLAFITLPTPWKNLVKVGAPPYLYSGPSPTASLATGFAGFDVNEARGDALRAELHRLSARVLSHVHGLGAMTPNTSGYPIIELPLAPGRDLADVARTLWSRGIYVTLAPYPMVPRDQVGFRIQITAAHTDAQIDQLNHTLTELWTRGDLRAVAPGEGEAP